MMRIKLGPDKCYLKKKKKREHWSVCSRGTEGVTVARGGGSWDVLVLGPGHWEESQKMGGNGRNSTHKGPDMNAHVVLSQGQQEGHVVEAWRWGSEWLGWSSGDKQGDNQKVFQGTGKSSRNGFMHGRSHWLITKLSLASVWITHF